MEEQGERQGGAARPSRLEPTPGSVLDWLPLEDQATFSEGERYLASLVVSPSEVASLDSADPFRVSLVQVDDPNGNTRIDGRWYEPRLLKGDCAFKTDQAPIPTVKANFVPGEPSQSTAEDQFAAMQAPIVFSLELYLFDTPFQRDSFAELMREATFYTNDMECSMFDGDESRSRLFPTIEERPSIEVGHPGFGMHTTSTFGSGLNYQYSVGEWLLLRVGTGSMGMGEDDSKMELEAADIEPFLNAQIAQLEKAGLG